MTGCIPGIICKLKYSGGPVKTKWATQWEKQRTLANTNLEVDRLPHFLLHSLTNKVLEQNPWTSTPDKKRFTNPPPPDRVPPKRYQMPKQKRFKTYLFVLQAEKQILAKIQKF